MIERPWWNIGTLEVMPEGYLLPEPIMKNMLSLKMPLIVFTYPSKNSTCWMSYGGFGAPRSSSSYPPKKSNANSFSLTHFETRKDEER